MCWPWHGRKRSPAPRGASAWTRRRSRGLRAVEGALGARLFEHLPGGVLRPTGAGEAALVHAEHAEAAVAGFADAVTGADSMPEGTVRVTAVPVLVSRVLAQASRALTARHPGLRLELVAEPRDLSLTRREADIAVRLARPSPDTGRAVLARRVGQLDYAVYAPASCPAGGEGAPLPWIGYEEGMAGLPHARWTIAAAVCGSGLSPVAVNDAEAVVGAVRAGLGRAPLPRIVGDAEPGLRRVAPPERSPPLPRREVWLLTHPDLRPIARVGVVAGWLTQVFRRPQAPASLSDVAPLEHTRF